VLAALAVLFAALAVAVGMWPYRHRVATLSFWLMAIALALGALGTFVLLVAGFYEGLDALRAMAASGGQQQPARPAPAEDTGDREPSRPAPRDGAPTPPAPLLAPDLTPDAPRRRIPAPPSTFIGRQRELDELTAAVADGGVIISGTGGVGKTALALELARRLAPDYPDGSILVDLRPTSSALAPADVLGRLIHTLHPQAQLPASQPELGRRYRSAFDGKRALLLLEDAAGPDQVRPLVPPASCALLITSRRRFHMPGMHTLDLGLLSEGEARELLGRIAPRIGDDAAEFAGLCGRLPLALELAAGALAGRPDLDPTEVLGPLRDERDRLEPVDAVLGLSYDLLDGRLQRLWARLGVFSIPFEPDAAAAVWQTGLGEALDGLARLLRHGLVNRRENVERYGLHALARTFACRKLQEMEDPRPVHRRAAAYLEARLAGEGWGISPQESLEVVDQWERAGAWDRFAESAGALMSRLFHMGYWDAIEARLKRALAAVEDHLDDPLLKVMLLNNLGVMARKRGQGERAIELYRRSLETLEPLDDAQSKAATSRNLANVYADQGEWDRAIELYRRSLETFRRAGDVRRMAQTSISLGTVYADKGEYDAAIDMFQQGLDVFERLHDLQGIVRAWDNLGQVYAAMGDWDRAIQSYLKDLQASQRMGDVPRMARTRVSLGMAYARSGDKEQAIKMYQQSLETFERLGDVRGTAAALHVLGLAYAERRQWDRAIEYSRRSLQTYQRLGDVRRVALTSGQLGNTYSRKGEWDRAIECYQQSLTALGRLDDIHSMAHTRTRIGGLYLRTGRAEEAKPHLRRAYLVFSHLGSPHADTAARALVEACGSVEAANAYLAEQFQQVD
jgi:tetratricopeptide (TPR) repeat protein